MRSFRLYPSPFAVPSDPRLSLDKCQRLQVFGCLVKTLDADWSALPIGIGEGGNHPPQGPSPISIPEHMEWELPINAPGREITQIMLEQVTLSASAILHRQRSDHKTGNVAPRLALAHVLPIEPDPFASIANEAVHRKSTSELQSTLRIAYAGF